MKEKSVDKIFLGIVLTLIIFGVIMFTSASLGILAVSQVKFSAVLFDQFIFGLVGGGVAFYFALKIPYKFWREYSLPFFIASIVLVGCVFVPHLGFAHGGAKRWISLLGVSLQPVEFLKIGFIMYFAAFLSFTKGKIKDARFSVMALIAMMGTFVVLLLKQPDTKSLILIAVTTMVMLFVSGIPWKYILGILLVSATAFIMLAMFTPYLHSRLETFLHPSQNQSGSSYQLNQSLIAIGSGGILGRGLGQSIQKFNYLPEPQGDSIFAVIGEELGFVGCVALIILFLAFAFRGYIIAYNAPDSFSKLFVIGTITILTAQAFMNIASIIGVFPLTGVPLIFISQGGTSLLITIASVGIVLNISRFQKKSTN